MTPTEVIRNYVIVEGKRNVDDVLALYTPDAVLKSPDARRTGWDQIRPFYEDAATRFPELRTTVVQTVEEENWVVAEWDAIMVGPTGDELHLEGINLVRVEGDLIAEVRAYYDTGEYA
ncbi:MAG TPA: nuclear transport factor 2 family protein [Kribbella sp.]